MLFKKYNKWPMANRVFELLWDNNWKWISAWDIVNKCKVLHYTDAISKIRKNLKDIKEDWEWKFLQNKTKISKNKYGDKVRETFYKLDL